MDVTTQVGSQEIDDSVFETFVAISTKVLWIAMKAEDPSIDVRWFKSYSDSMKKTDFTMDNLNYLFSYFPDLNSVTAIDLNEDFIESVHEMLETVIRDWKFKSQRLKGLIAEFKRNGPPPILFNYRYEIFDSVIHNALLKYIETGELMRSDDVHFKQSNLFQMEEILLNRRPAIEKCLGPGCFAEPEDQFRTGFIAIVAPSLEGKTQSAFALRRVNPLYFVLPTKPSGVSVRTQEIYFNYSILSMKLFELSRKDIAEYFDIKPNVRSEDYLFLQISATNLGVHFGAKKFRVLGFIAALIDHARKHFTSSTTMTWMEFYTTAPRNLEFQPMSLAEMATFDFAGFFVFLDEFVGLDENVFVRNVCRAAGITVVVANTNTKAANLIGRDSSMHTRTGGNYAWCLVINHLNTLNGPILKLMVPSLEASIQSLKFKVKQSDLRVLENFFVDFLQSQSKQLRPGFARAIADIIVFYDVTAQSNFSFLDFLNFLILVFGNFLFDRKKNVNEKYEGMMGTKALYMLNAYDTKITEKLESILHHKNYLNFHYFYLINPVYPKKWCFLTFPPVPATETLVNGVVQVERQEAQAPIRVKYEYGRLDGWIKEVTFFKSGEFLAYLSFLSLWHVQSINSIFKYGLERHQTNPEGTAEMTNPTQAVPLSGNYLEVLSTVCMINSSHRSIDSSVMTLSGQSGGTFFSNLVKNLIFADGKRIDSAITVSFDAGCEVDSLMELIHVPFLFPANLPIPEFFRPFASAEGFNQRSIHVGTFERTENIKEIDAKFQFFFKNRNPSLIPSLRICAVECKFWKNSLGLKDLLAIFEKADAQFAKLSIVVCKQISDFTDESSRDFISICLGSRWNALRIFKSSAGFEFRKIDAEITSEDGLYSMHCIVIELDTVNRN